MKKILGVILAIFMVFVGGIKAQADEVGATFAYFTESNPKLGEEFAVDVIIKDVDVEAITGAIALMDFDKEYLEIVSIVPNINNPLAIFSSKNKEKFAGLSLTGEGIKEDTAILTVVFKPIKEGKTTLSFSELDLCDTKAKSFTGTMEELNITIEKEVEELKETKLITSEETIAIEKPITNNEATVEKQVSTSEKISEEKKENAKTITKQEKNEVIEKNDRKEKYCNTIFTILFICSKNKIN